MRRSGNGRPVEQEDEADRPGPLDRDEREATCSEDANQKGNRTSAKTPPTHGLDGPTRVASACERRGASGAGWAKGRVGRKVGRAKTKKKNF
jgi:hypothetical protein